jgi:alkanesulfonate monooxygenase SsuD/methylene tetrahydromethanopterin reductase-like flavin-dependent oxidoreductase (luciferase family)
MTEVAGRNPASIVVRAPGADIVTNDVAAARQAYKQHLAFYVSRMGVYYHTQLTEMGRGDEVNAIRNAWDEGRSAGGAAAVSDDLLAAFACIVTPDQLDDAVARLEVQRAAGVDLHQITLTGIHDQPEQRRILEHLVG